MTRGQNPKTPVSDSTTPDSGDPGPNLVSPGPRTTGRVYLDPRNDGSPTGWNGVWFRESGVE